MLAGQSVWFEQQGHCVIKSYFFTKGYFTLVPMCCKLSWINHNKTIHKKNKDLVKNRKWLRKRYKFKHFVIFWRAQRIFLPQYAPFTNLVMSHLFFEKSTLFRCNFWGPFLHKMVFFPFLLPCSLFLDLIGNSKSQPKAWAVWTESIAGSRGFTITAGRWYCWNQLCCKSPHEAA